MGLWEELYDKARSFFGESSDSAHKRCYYELLDVQRDASEDEIKRSYKKLALKWHPDKNPERKDECTAYFVLLQQAYEVLVDPQERAFYDKHRENIIQGSSPEEKKDTGIDLYSFFQKCYRGFEDDEDGFFTIYRNLFDTLASEEFAYIEDDDEKDFPTFGSSTSDYDQVVGPFYDRWTSFSTQRSFAWLDKYDLRNADDRYTLKCMDKENKKFRDTGKKQRNEEIRNLVQYVRKRDPRVKVYREQLESRKRKEFERVEQQRKDQIIRNLRKFEEHDAPEVLNDDYLDELDKLETELDEQFGAFAVDGEDNPDSYYCIVCEKSCKTSKAYTNHQKSNKHRKAVEALKEFMAKENELLDEETEDQEPVVNEEESSEQAAKKIRNAPKPLNKKKDKTKSKINKNELVVGEEVSISASSTDDESQKIKKSSDSRRKQTEKPTSRSANGGITIPIESSCMICNETFPSRSKLFEHIKATGHAALKENASAKSKKKRR